MERMTTQLHCSEWCNTHIVDRRVCVTGMSKAWPCQRYAGMQSSGGPWLTPGVKAEHVRACLCCWTQHHPNKLPHVNSSHSKWCSNANM